jgi:asparagine synthase (glutamine-hydrolysing)
VCGIAGLVTRRGTPDRATLSRMADGMIHRGPDEEGFHVGEGVGLAFRRLRIIDLHTGSQPQANEDGTVHVVFNGEIYNHDELRERLRARGHVFRTRSDTEVLVHLWEDHGEDLVRELNGMFAIAIWDDRAKSLFLARDRMGIKPLLWALTDTGLSFGSEMSCLLAAGGVDEGIDGIALHEYLSWGAVPAPRTLLRGVRRLEPGHSLLWKDGRVSKRRYWHPVSDAADRPASYEEGCRRLRELLEDSVRLRRVADVPLGAFLSGGVDSTAIVGTMARLGGDVRTFAIGFTDDPVFDETPFARDASRFHGTTHTERSLHAEDIRDLIPHVLDHLDEPFGSSSLLPAFAVSRETRRNVTVALSGDGADELFAGYNKYLGDVYRAWYGRVPRGIRRSLLSPAIRSLPASRGSRLGEFGRKARRFLDGLEGDAADRHDRWMRIAGAEEVSALLGEPRSNPGLEEVRARHAEWDELGDADDALNRTLYTDLTLALPSDMLLKVDHASMMNSLEVRVPFLDHRLVELAMAMPGDWKMHGTHRKRILKDAVGDLLPPSIRRRPKAGFDVPVGEWLKTDLRDLFWDTVNGDTALPLDRDLLRGWYDEHVSGRAERSKILWAAFTLRWWERRRPHAAHAGTPGRPMHEETAVTAEAGVTG